MRDLRAAQLALLAAISFREFLALTANRGKSLQMEKHSPWHSNPKSQLDIKSSEFKNIRKEMRILCFKGLVLGLKESGICFTLSYGVRNFSAQIANSLSNSTFSILTGHKIAGFRALSLR